MIDLSAIRNHKSLDKLRDRSFLFGIGGQRCGSTWLASRLSAHPEVAFSEIKELQFFNMTLPARFPGLSARYKRLLEVYENRKPQRPKMARRTEAVRRRVQMEKDPGEYFQYFADIIGDKPVFGEITPEYVFLTPETLAVLKSLDLNFKVIYLVRNPVDRYISALSYKKTAYPKFNIRKALLGHLQNPNFVGHTLYHETIDRYQSVFNGDNFLFLYYEDLLSEDRHADCMKRIAEFLSISDFQNADLSRKVNATEKVTVRPRTRQIIADRFHDVYIEMKKRSGRLPAKWQTELDGAESLGRVERMARVAR